MPITTVITDKTAPDVSIINLSNFPDDLPSLSNSRFANFFDRENDIVITNERANETAIVNKNKFSLELLNFNKKSTLTSYNLYDS
jgi:hypothetical protein